MDVFEALKVLLNITTFKGRWFAQQCTKGAPQSADVLFLSIPLIKPFMNKSQRRNLELEAESSKLIQLIPNPNL